MDVRNEQIVRHFRRKQRIENIKFVSTIAIIVAGLIYLATK